MIRHAGRAPRLTLAAGRGVALAAGLATLGWASLPASAQQPFSASAPVALVESIEDAPNAGVELLDYVYAGQAIDLGASGVMVLSYFDSCVRETIASGRVHVGAGSSTVSGGTIDADTVSCQGAKTIVTADASEAGAAVKRVTPFVDEEWREFTVRYVRPVFKWQPERRGQKVTVTLTYLDATPARVVWQGETRKAFLLYPKEAPRLEVGMPYLVQVSDGRGASVGAVFSVDPWLNVADNAAANWVVPLGR